MDYSRIINAATIAEALGGRRSGQGWRAPCPVRDHNSNKQHPFSITDGNDGTPLVYCHAGCDFQDIVSELKSRGLWPEISHGQARECRQRKKFYISKTQLDYARTFIEIVKSDIEAGRTISPGGKIILKKCVRLLKAHRGSHAY